MEKKNSQKFTEVSPAGVRRKMEWHGNLYRTPVTTENYDL
jgi:hypothetical protein